MVPRCLMLGAGVGDAHPEGEFVFTHLDINPDRKPDVVGDATSLPFDNNSYEVVIASHLLEHLSPRKYGNVLEEWYRVLAPGGEMMVLVPNLSVAAEYILTDPEKVVYQSCAGPITAMDMIYGLPGIGMHHEWGFTRESLARRAMEMAWAGGAVWEQRFANPLDRSELRLYGRKPGDHPWKGLDPDVSKTGDPYVVKLGGDKHGG